MNASTQRTGLMPMEVITHPRNGLRQADRTRIEEWLKNRLGNEHVKTVFEEVRN